MVGKNFKKEIKLKEKMKQYKHKKSTFWSFLAYFIIISSMAFFFSYFSMSKYEVDAVEKSVSEQRSIKDSDLKKSLNNSPGGYEVADILDKNKHTLDQKFVKSIQSAHMDISKVKKLSGNTLSSNQARILLATLTNMKLKNIALSAKKITQNRIYNLIVMMFISIFFISIISLYKTKKTMAVLNSTNFIGTALKEMITFITLSVGTYTIINSLFSGENISSIESLSMSLTFLYAWMPVNIMLLAGVAAFNIFSTTISEK